MHQPPLTLTSPLCTTGELNIQSTPGNRDIQLKLIRKKETTAGNKYWLFHVLTHNRLLTVKLNPKAESSPIASLSVKCCITASQPRFCFWHKMINYWWVWPLQWLTAATGPLPMWRFLHSITVVCRSHKFQISFLIKIKSSGLLFYFFFKFKVTSLCLFH